MKYLTYLALVGLVQPKSVLIVDEEKIVDTAESFEDNFGRYAYSKNNEVFRTINTMLDEA